MLITVFMLCSSAAASVADLISSASLTASATLPMPTNPIASNRTVKDGDSAAAFILSQWYTRRVSFGWEDIAFVKDPIGNETVLQLGFGAGSFGSQSGNSTGGCQFTSQPINLTQTDGPDTGIAAALVSYSVLFEDGFDFALGGKLPGLRGGQWYGCSGGDESDGSACFSSRLMWRQAVNMSSPGEIYAYVPVYPGFCDGLVCNDEYGISIGRGQFTFQAGQWYNLSLFAQMNDVNVANGILQLFVNDQLAINQTDIVFTTASSLHSITGIFFSSFFGGSTQKWASPKSQAIYFKDIQMFAGSKDSPNDGPTVTATAQRVTATTDLPQPTSWASKVVVKISSAFWFFAVGLVILFD